MENRQKNLVFIVLFTLIGYLGVYENSLAIYHSGKAKPTITSRSVAIYPEADQKALKDGILFSDQAEFSRLMEDFLS